MMAKEKMTVEDARELKGDLELGIKESLDAFTKVTGIVITKITVKLHEYDTTDEQIRLMDVDIYNDVDTMAVL
jgi:predicted acyltransferase (DUF342 family)